MQARRQRATAWWWALPPAIAVTILFLPALLGERLHFYEDLATGTYPMRVYLAESLRNGELPLWCPLVFCGYPLMAEGQMGTLYPPNALLFLALPGPAAQEVSLLLHYLLGIFGMFVFLGTLRLSAPARSVGALAFALSGYMTARLGYINLIEVAAWLPLLLLAAGRVALTGSTRWALLLACVAAAQLMAGHPHTMLYCVIAAGSWFVATVYRGECRVRAAILFVAAMVTASLVAAAQLMPTLELALRSQRGAGLSATEAGMGSMSPAWIVTWVFPYFFGLSDPDRFVFPGFASFWGGTSFWELCAYPGVTALALSLVTRRGTRGRRFFLGLAAAGLILALGKYSPLFALLRRLPVLGWFRLPARALLLTTFSVAVLAAMGLDSAISGRCRRPTAFTALAICVLGAVAILPLSRLVLSAGEDVLAARVGRLIEQRKTPPVGGEDLWRDYHPTADSVLGEMDRSTRVEAAQNVYFAVLLVVSAGVVVLLARQRIGKGAGIAAVILLLGTDLTVFGLRYNPTVPATVAETPPQVAGHLPPHDDGTWRLWATNDTQYFLSDYHRSAPPDTFADPWPAALALLPLNHNIMWKIPSPMGRVPLPLAPFHRLQQWLEHNTLRRTMGVLGLCNVRFLLTYRAAPGLPLLAEGDDWYLYENPQVLPRAFVLPDTTNHDPADVTLDEILAGRAALPGRDEIAARAPAWEARVASFGPHRVTVETALEGRGWLVLTEAFYPGWSASVNGRAVPIIRAYGLFRAVRLEAGRHSVAFFYRPQSLRKGVVLSLIGCLTAAALAVPKRRRRA